MQRNGISHSVAFCVLDNMNGVFMEWTIEYIAEQQLIYIKTKGILTNENANLMIKDVVQEMAKHECLKQIVDHRETIFELSVREYYERPDINKEIGISYSWKIAMVFKELSENTRFMETVFRNRGYNFHQFDDIDKAMEWLLSDS